MVVAEKPSFQRGKYRSSLYVGKKGCMCNHAHECFSAHTRQTHTHTIEMLVPGGPRASTFYCICATRNYLKFYSDHVLLCPVSDFAGVGAVCEMKSGIIFYHFTTLLLHISRLTATFYICQSMYLSFSHFSL